MSDGESDISLSDEENDIQDLEQLNAVLSEDDDCPSTSVSQYSATRSLFSVDQSEQTSKIDAAIALNNMYDEKLRRLESILNDRLRECRERLKDIQYSTDDAENKAEVFYYVSCGRPYFKDSTNFPAPDNDDTILMNRSKMYDFSTVSSVISWTVKDKSYFLNLLLKMSKEIRKKELQSSISDLNRQLKSSPKKKDIQKKISSLNLQITKVNDMSLKELALPIDKDYDWLAIANMLKNRHTAGEYQSLWQLFLHPSINKKPWSKAEHTALQRICYEENLQDWDKIAKRLNTGRTNYQCFVYFRTNMSNTFTGRKWSPEEVEYLKRLIDYYKEDNYIPWGKVATSMENRTKIQIYNKYLSLCQQRKGRFLPEEDAVILTCAENFGPDYQKMTQYLPGRTTNQCRMRYQVLRKTRISKVWTIDEDKRLIQLMANQDSAINFSSITKYFPGKDRINIRSRYLTLTNWMKRYPNIDVSKAPRRGARRLGHGSQADNLNKAIEELKNRIQTEVNDVKNKKVSPESPHEVLDDAIVAYLATEHVNIEEARKLEEFRKLDEKTLQGNCKTLQTRSNVKSNLRDLRAILTLLRVKLNKERYKRSVPKRYRGLLEPDPNLIVSQVKSYSKKNPEVNVPVDDLPDIWGTQRLGPLEYVLPANYSTLTGCKKLLSYISDKPSNDNIVNIKILSRKNLFLKEQMFLLMERFNVLFLWPMLLSNAPPDRALTEQTSNEDEEE
ncbi:snRNA-activating protein complex subunit 4 [Aricia agestis]|uniref:snRNA-activating protein complex subunit 4 n=1 Tax=Aricia agestis TaxID=91739 RepID=UPI001C206EDB|nr:snRNA-activating protein complex subunit 4 [Aricia agestis]